MNIIINHITKKSTINNTVDKLNVKGCSYKTYVSNNYKPQIAYVGNSLYKRFDNRTFNSTYNIYNHISQYPTDVFNNYKVNETHNVKKTFSNFTNDVAINKHNTININDTYNISKTDNLLNSTDNQYLTKKISSTSNITNNVTRHNHNNYELNVIKHFYKHIKHINNYGTKINYYYKKSLNKGNCYNFYNDSFQFQKDWEHLTTSTN